MYIYVHDFLVNPKYKKIQDMLDASSITVCLVQVCVHGNKRKEKSFIWLQDTALPLLYAAACW